MTKKIVKNNFDDGQCLTKDNAPVVSKVENLNDSKVVKSAKNILSKHKYAFKVLAK